MLKKRLMLLLSLTVLICSPCAFSETHELISGIKIKYKFPPNVPQVFKNSFLWTIKATCKINIDEQNQSATVSAKGLKNKAKVNDILLTKDSSFSWSIHSGDILNIKAYKGAKVKIINEGKHILIASCQS